MIGCPSRHLLSIADSLVSAEEASPDLMVLLARQVLEQAAVDYWRRACPGVERSPRGIQMLCLQAFMDDRQLAVDAYATWKTLSGFAHHRPYDPSPTVRELDSVWYVIRRFVEHLERQTVR